MVEQAPYDLIEKIEDIEIRKYPELLIAKVKSEGDISFNFLFNYISGDNKSQNKIPMTAPVISSEKIKMTAPVISKKDYMAFVMPKNYNIETIPKPINEKVKIEMRPKKTVAVLRFSSRVNNKKTNENIKRLLTILENNDLKTKGEPFLMSYNSPFTPGFLRRNEVAIEID